MKLENKKSLSDRLKEVINDDDNVLVVGMDNDGTPFNIIQGLHSKLIGLVSFTIFSNRQLADIIDKALGYIKYKTSINSSINKKTLES